MAIVVVVVVIVATRMRMTNDDVDTDGGDENIESGHYSGKASLKDEGLL